jgi:transglutaminase-like putative cysteine protease
MLARLKLREGWITFFLLGALLLTVAGAIQQADWSDELTILTPVTLAALVVGLVLAKWRRLPSLLAPPLAVLAGTFFIVHQLDPVLPLAKNQHGWLPAARFLLMHGQLWFAAAGTDKYADDYYLFLLGLAAIVWLVAYASTWMIFRARWIWPAILMPAIVLLLNLGYAPASLSSYLVLFVICALLLVARFHVAEREEDWQRSGVAYPESLGWRALWIGALVAILTVGFGWLAPFSAHGAPLTAAWNQINGPWARVETMFNQKFGSLRGPSARGIGNFASFGDRFRLGGPLKLSQNPILLLQADKAYYLKVRTYDTFDGHQWDSNVDATFNHLNDGRQYVPQIDLHANQDLAVQTPQATERKDLTVRMLASRGSGLFTADQFISASEDTYVVLSWTQYHNQVFDLTTMHVEDFPPDLRPVVTLLQTASGPLRNTDAQGNLLRVTGSDGFVIAAPTPALPSRGTPRATPGTPVPTPTPYIPQPSPYEKTILDEKAALANRLVQVRWIVKNGIATQLIVNGQLPNYGDVEAVLPHSTVNRGTTYQAAILTSTAQAPALRGAGGDYPDWVVQRYLELPASTTDRTKQLARQLQNGQDPYDAALTIQNWLRQNMKYNENINYPPQDQDVVDYFLFNSKQGYCEYYSTAMVIMLRSIGIPAREAVGLFPGEYDNDQGGFLYRESNAHAWPEAYFPGYGWIAFEPTSPRPAFDREPAAPNTSTDTGNTDPGAASGVIAGASDPISSEEPGFDSGGPGVPGQVHSAPSPVWRVLRIALPVLALLAAVLTALWLWSLRGLSPGGQFYARMTRSSALAGVRPPPGTTPYEWARVVGERVPDARRSLNQIADLYVREQYAGHQPTLQEMRLARRAWLTFREALLRSVFTLRRRLSDER